MAVVAMASQAHMNTAVSCSRSGGVLGLGRSRAPHPLQSMSSSYGDGGARCRRYGARVLHIRSPASPPPPPLWSSRVTLADCIYLKKEIKQMIVLLADGREVSRCGDVVFQLLERVGILAFTSWIFQTASRRFKRMNREQQARR